VWLFVVVVIGNTRAVTIIIMKNRQIQIQKLFFFCFVVWHAVVEASRIEPFLGKNKCQTTIWASPQHNTHLVFITEEEEEEEEEE